MLSFYARRSQKLKKDSQLKQFFALLGSVGVKANIHVDEIDPGGLGEHERMVKEGRLVSSSRTILLLVHQPESNFPFHGLLCLHYLIRQKLCGFREMFLTINQKYLG